MRCSYTLCSCRLSFRFFFSISLLQTCILVVGKLIPWPKNVLYLFSNPLLNLILECCSHINLCTASCLHVYLQMGRFRNINECNDISIRGYSQSWFNYHGQVPHHGWNFHYAGDMHLPHEISRPVGPLHQPQPVAYYCKICEVRLGNYKNMEQHNNGKKHRRMLSLHEESQRPRMSKGDIPNSQVNLAVQPSTVQNSPNNECQEKNVSSEATVAKHKNYLQKDIAVSPEVPAEGKPRDNTSAQGHNFKHNISGTKTGKYMKTNDGLRRSMEPSKFDINSVSDSIDSPVQIPALTPQLAVISHTMTPSPVVGTSFKHVYQRVLALQTEVLKVKENHEIQNPAVETNGHPHVVADSNLFTQPEDVSSDSVARVLGLPKMRYFQLPNCNNDQLEMHNKRKIHQDIVRHQDMLRCKRESKLKEEILRKKTSNGQILDSQKNLVQHKTAQISGKNKDQLKNMSFEASILKHNNFLQKGKGLSSEIPAKGPEMKARDNSGAKQHRFKHKIRGTNTGKYIKTNDGVRRPMESSKLNIKSLSKSVESPVRCSIQAVPKPVASQTMTPTLVAGSSFEQHFQQVSASKTPVSEGKEHYEIQNCTAEITDHPHAPTDSNINTQIEDKSYDSAAIAMAPSEGFMASQVCPPLLAVTSCFEPQNQRVLQTDVLESKEHQGIQNSTFETNDQLQSISMELHTPVGLDINSLADVSSDTDVIAIGPQKMLTESHAFEVSLAVGSNFESQTQYNLQNETEPQLSKGTADCESQNCTDEKNNQLLPSVVVEFNSPPGSSTSTQTSDGCYKDEQKMNILTCLSRTTQLSQVAVCLTCGSECFPETLVFCNKCQVYALHRYCLDGPVIFTDDVIWFCEGCEPKVGQTSFHDQGTLLLSDENVSLNLENEVSPVRIEPKTCIESIKSEPKNIAKATMLLSDNHSLSYAGLSQYSNNNEHENKSKKKCTPVPKDDVNTIEQGSMIIAVPHPIADPVWRGNLRLFEPNFSTIVGLLAHMSSLACSKVLEETKHFPDVLCSDLLPKSMLWPKSFMKCGPKEDSIALYFFPDSESVERCFDKLVDDMISHDLSLRAVVENAELLIFPSIVLPIQCRRFQEKYFLWGVFRAKK
ncbi:hypothetical protein VNO78_32954 [Psophocarpus tetragonolobus]|uniref:U1-type domain-containing protein n=1 Tax=Psophocarpus tetragonolobus TaxID=3891 RepID=A0AAN9P199_PSOTE